MNKVAGASMIAGAELSPIKSRKIQNKNTNQTCQGTYASHKTRKTQITDCLVLTITGN